MNSYWRFQLKLPKMVASVVDFVPLGSLFEEDMWLKVKQPKKTRVFFVLNSA